MLATSSSKVGTLSGSSMSLLALFFTLLASSLGVNATSPVQVPYNPWYIDNQISRDQSAAFILAPKDKSTTFQLQQLDLTQTFKALDPPITVISDQVPFTNGHESVTQSFAVASNGNASLAVYVGDCVQNSSSTMYSVSSASTLRKPYWMDMPVSGDNDPRFLSSMIAYQNGSDPTYYVLGGMCPDSDSGVDTNASDDWIGDSSYSSQLTEFSMNHADYHAEKISDKTRPIAQAGYTLTPLNQSSEDSSSDYPQRSYALIGGHTKDSSFNNFSTIALLSLPEKTWTSVEVESDSSGLSKDSKAKGFESRTGHTAVLSSDGKKILVIGGWVENTTRAAQPQLAILDIPKKYGGDSTSWKWRVPINSENSPFENNAGLYGHAATMLPGGVVMVIGGYDIPASSGTSRSRRRRDNSGFSKDALLFNVDKESWEDSYTSPQAFDEQDNGGGISHGGGIALGLCLGIGFLVLFGFICFYLRRKNSHRMRESQSPTSTSTMQERGEIVSEMSDESHSPMSKKSSNSSATTLSTMSSHETGQDKNGENVGAEALAHSGFLRNSGVTHKDAARPPSITDLSRYPISDITEKTEHTLTPDGSNTREHYMYLNPFKDSKFAPRGLESAMTSYTNTVTTNRSGSISVEPVSHARETEEFNASKTGRWTDSSFAHDVNDNANAPYTPIDLDYVHDDREMPERKGSLPFPFDYSHSISAHIEGKANLSDDWSSLQKFMHEHQTDRTPRCSQDGETSYPAYSQPAIVTTAPSPRGSVHEELGGVRTNNLDKSQVFKKDEYMGPPRTPDAASAHRESSEWQFGPNPFPSDQNRYSDLRRSVSNHELSSIYSFLQNSNRASSPQKHWSISQASERSPDSRVNRQSFEKSFDTLEMPSFAFPARISRNSSSSNWPLPRANEGWPPSQTANLDHQPSGVVARRFSSSPIVYPTTNLPDQTDQTRTPRNCDSIYRLSGLSNCGSI